MRKPIIGIVSKPKQKKEKNIWNKMYIADEIRYLIVKNGGLAISLLSPEETMDFNKDDINDKKILTKQEKDDIFELAKLCDGIILQGGMTSSNYEIEYAKKAIELNKPIIGICAGFNNLLRALGGDVEVNNTNSHNYLDKDYRHPITIVKDTKLHSIIKKDKIDVNSIHSLVATKESVESLAKISSYSEDGLVESFELNNKKFAMGIKWHPELMLNEQYVDEIFKMFIDSAKEKEDVWDYKSCKNNAKINSNR